MKKYIKPTVETITLCTGDLMDVLTHGSPVNQNPEENNDDEGSFGKFNRIDDSKFSVWDD